MRELAVMFEELQGVVPDLSPKAALAWSCCGVCVSCKERYGLRGILDGGHDRGYHYELEFDGTPRIFGGKVARATGRTDSEAWANLLMALA